MLVRAGFVGACFVVAGLIVCLYPRIYGATCMFTGFVSVTTSSITGFFGAIIQSRAFILVIADAFLESHEMN